jgi:hypothetical protein
MIIFFSQSDGDEDWKRIGELQILKVTQEFVAGPLSGLCAHIAEEEMGRTGKRTYVKAVMPGPERLLLHHDTLEPLVILR